MKFATISAIAFGAVSCYATAVPRQNTGTQCNTGPIQCCNQVMNYSDTDPTTLNTVANFFGASVGKSFQGQFGVNCSPVSVIGVGGNSCSSTPVCCQRVESSGIFAWNCSPVNVNL